MEQPDGQELPPHDDAGSEREEGGQRLGVLHGGTASAAQLFSHARRRVSHGEEEQDCVVAPAGERVRDGAEAGGVAGETLLPAGDGAAGSAGVLRLLHGERGFAAGGGGVSEEREGSLRPYGAWRVLSRGSAGRSGRRVCAGGRGAQRNGEERGDARGERNGERYGKRNGSWKRAG